MMFFSEDIIKLLLAVFVGALIGAEREFRDKSAGFRTIIFICLGATIFTIISLKLGGDRNPAQIAAYIVSGVGFLGAGAILRDGGRIVGLTTASTIWIGAALGMAIGGGYFLFALSAAVIILVILWIFPRLEIKIDNIYDIRTYEIVTLVSKPGIETTQRLIGECGLRVMKRRRSKIGGKITSTWQVSGFPKHHEQFVEKLFAQEDIEECKV